MHLQNRQERVWIIFVEHFNNRKLNSYTGIQARIAPLVAYWLGAGEVPGSNPGKGENFSGKISNKIVRI